jgi:hypothetical protein
MISNRQGKTEVSPDLVEWLSQSDLRDLVRSFGTDEITPDHEDRRS